MPQQPAPPPSQPVQQFIKNVSDLATRLGIRSLMLALVDPGTGYPRIVASPGAKEALRPALAADLNVIDPTAPNAREQAVRLLGIRDAAEAEADTGWDAG